MFTSFQMATKQITGDMKESQKPMPADAQREIAQAAAKINDINLLTEPTPQKTPSGSPLKGLTIDM